MVAFLQRFLKKALRTCVEKVCDDCCRLGKCKGIPLGTVQFKSIRFIFVCAVAGLQGYISTNSGHLETEVSPYSSLQHGSSSVSLDRLFCEKQFSKIIQIVNKIQGFSFDLSHQKQFDPNKFHSPSVCVLKVVVVKDEPLSQSQMFCSLTRFSSYIDLCLIKLSINPNQLPCTC